MVTLLRCWWLRARYGWLRFYTVITLVGLHTFVTVCAHSYAHTRVPFLIAFVYVGLRGAFYTGLLIAFDSGCGCVVHGVCVYLRSTHTLLRLHFTHTRYVAFTRVTRLRLRLVCGCGAFTGWIVTLLICYVAVCVWLRWLRCVGCGWFVHTRTPTRLRLRLLRLVVGYCWLLFTPLLQLHARFPTRALPAFTVQLRARAPLDVYGCTFSYTVTVAF